MTSPALSKQRLQSAIQMAFRYLSYQARTTKEMQTYLQKKQLDHDLIKAVVTYLTEKKFLDDGQYASSFVENKILNQPKSAFAMNFDLKKKGIPADIRSHVLQNIDDQKMAQKAIEKKFRTWFSFDDEKFKKKAMNHLRYRGFNYKTSWEATRHFLYKKKTEKEETL